MCGGGSNSCRARAADLFGTVGKFWIATAGTDISGVTFVCCQGDADDIRAWEGTTRSAPELRADGILLRPIQWPAIETSKDDAGSYLAGGPFAMLPIRRLRGVPVALSAAILAGRALVGAFRSGAGLFRKGGIRLEASNSQRLLRQELCGGSRGNARGARRVSPVCVRRGDGSDLVRVGEGGFTHEPGAALTRAMAPDGRAFRSPPTDLRPCTTAVLASHDAEMTVRS